MKLILVTGQLAKTIVKKYAQESAVWTSVIDLPVSVAAFLTPKYIAKKLKGRDLHGFDMILLPGLISGDVSDVEKATGIPTFKGPQYAADLPVVLNMLDEVKLSKVIPASDLLRDRLRKRALEEIFATKRDQDKLLSKARGMLIGGKGREVAIGDGFPMRVMAEITNAPLLSDREIWKRARYYANSGADIIDVGMIAGESRPEDAERAVKVTKDAVDLPVSIDTLDPEEIATGVSAGADMVLSVDAGNMEEVATVVSNIPVVILPTNHRKSHFPRKWIDKVNFLNENLEKARKLGITKVIGDLILNPVNEPGIVESLVACYEFSRRNPTVPLLFGAGNVSELMDADTVGVNALLAGIASELGANIIFTTEASDKTRGCVRELATAVKMMFLAKRRNSVPKDLGLDLLILKDKRSREELYDPEVEKDVQVITTEKAETLRMDPKGCFKILLDRENEKIVALHFSKSKQRMPDLIIKGKNANEVYTTIIEMGLVSRLDHAAYLGCELEKAEIALKTGKGYVQDSLLFNEALTLGSP